MVDQLVHTPQDGRAPRLVFLNGKPLDNCVYANERKSKVRVIPRPIRLHKYRKRVLEKTLYGRVTVQFIAETPE